MNKEEAKIKKEYTRVSQSPQRGYQTNKTPIKLFQGHEKDLRGQTMCCEHKWDIITWNSKSVQDIFEFIIHTYAEGGYIHLYIKYNSKSLSQYQAPAQKENYPWYL